ncbi:GTPase family protein [Enterobacter cloacae]|uniref:GTPase family protein n=1 Tax=Enterobacter cloacae TaxID=550 RepID=UPI0032B0E2DC
MNTESPKETPFSQLLSRLPADVKKKIHRQLSSIISYEPCIGLMGKSGAGKSSLCNTLFSPPPARVDAVKGCTRTVQRYRVTHGTHNLTLVDFPGIGETPELDSLYRRLYQAWSGRLDLIVWVLKADERAWNEDIRCYRDLLRSGAVPARFLFVLSQADKIEPCREWDGLNHRPSQQQQHHLQAKTRLAETLFATAHPVVAVSAAEHYNLHHWVEALIQALPVHSGSAVSRHLHPELRTDTVRETAREGFVRVTGEIFDEAVNTLKTSGMLVRYLHQFRHRLLTVARAVWNLLF